jgi:hypothetical protein
VADRLGLAATGGLLRGTIAADPFDGGVPELEYRLDLEVVAGAVTGRLVLTGLPVPARSWTRLAGTRLAFAADEGWWQDGEWIRTAGVGALELAGREPLAASATAVEFDAVTAAGPAVRVRVAAAVGVEGGDTAIELTTTVTIGPVLVHADTPVPDPARCRRIAAGFLDLSGYREEPSATGLLLVPDPATTTDG